MSRISKPSGTIGILASAATTIAAMTAIAPFGAGPIESTARAWDVGRRRAAREEGSFSYRNATIIEQCGQYAGCLIGYAIPDNPEPCRGTSEVR